MPHSVFESIKYMTYHQHVFPAISMLEARCFIENVGLEKSVCEHFSAAFHAAHRLKR